jgi:hypothetical protein
VEKESFSPNRSFGSAEESVVDQLSGLHFSPRVEVRVKKCRSLSRRLLRQPLAGGYAARVPSYVARGAAMSKDSTARAMHDRIQFLNHQGKQILFVDFSNCLANEVEKIARAAPDYITVQPRGSVLVLTDFTGAAFDRDALRAMKETAVFDKPFVKKSALVGTENFPTEFYEELKSYSRRELLIFKTRQEALAWLVA